MRSSLYRRSCRTACRGRRLPLGLLVCDCMTPESCRANVSPSLSAETTSATRRCRVLHRLSAVRNYFGTLQLRQLARQPYTDVPHFLLDVCCCSSQMFAGHILGVALEDSMDPPCEVGGNRLAQISSRCLKSRRWRNAMTRHRSAYSSASRRQ